MACGKGIQTRTRDVLVPIRGQGLCPKPKTSDRWQEKQCNPHACQGDEFCVADQDLVLALDASGSLGEEGFDVVRNLAANLTMKYKDMYFGKEAMKVGLVQFGNGHLQIMGDRDNTVAVNDAITVQGLTFDLELVHKKVEELSWQNGFTNMAQALEAADTMMGQTGRASAMSGVLLITDGHYFMSFQTAQKARQLKDKGVMLYMTVLANTRGEEQNNLKSWVSQPWDTNYVDVPNIADLKFNSELYSSKIIATFCPSAVSPSFQSQQEDSLQCIKVREGGAPDADCSAMSMTETPATSPIACADTAREARALSFMLGKGKEAGKCAIMTLAITDGLFNKWEADRRDPRCPTGDWDPNPFWDVYACRAEKLSCGPGTGYGELSFATSTLDQNDLASGGELKLASIGKLDGQPLDLVITASGYQAWKPALNGFTGSFGRINIKTCTSADFTFTFQDASSGGAVPMDEFEVTFFDIDRGSTNNKIETLKVSGYSEMLPAAAPLYYYDESGGEAVISASTKGVGADNPSDPMMLTPQQISRSVAFKFSGKSSFEVHYDVQCSNGGNSNSGRNFLFAFHSSLTPCLITER
jgi:hypothetical protein